MEQYQNVYGLTGGIACGKSTVVSMFKERGICIIDADQVAREVVQPGEIAWQQIQERFGEDILLPDRQLNRAKLGEIIFSDDRAREDLNHIVHPQVHKRITESIGQAQKQSCPFTIVDVPLLIENNKQGMYEKVIVVYTDPEVQRTRLMKRDQLTLKQAEQRLQAQMAIEEKKKYGDYMIDNSGTIEETEKQVALLYETLKNHRSSHHGME